MIKVKFLLGIVAFLFAVNNIQAKKHLKGVVDVGSNYYKPGNSVVTPHIKWAKPYAGKKLKVFFFSFKNRMRSAVELFQRMDMDYEFQITRTNVGGGMLNPGFFREGYYKGDEPGDKLKRLRKLLKKKYDIYVWGQAGWDSLPQDVRETVLKRIKEGASFIRVTSSYYGNSFTKGIDKLPTKRLKVPARLAEGIPWKVLPVFEKYKDLKTFLNNVVNIQSYGKGKIINICGYGMPNHQILTPGFAKKPLWHRWERFWFAWSFSKSRHRELDAPVGSIKHLEYEYYMQFIIRLLLFAANEEPSVVVATDGKIQSVSFDKSSKLSIPLNSVQDIPSAQVVCKVRDWDNQIIFDATKQLDINSGNKNIEFNNPKHLPDGKYFVDLWVKNKQNKIIGFGSFPLAVNGKTNFITAKLSADNFKKKQTVTGTVDIKNPDSKKLFLNLVRRDTFDRVTMIEQIKLQTGTNKFELKAGNPLAVWQYLDISLTDGKETYDRKRLVYSISDLYLKDAVRLATWQWSFCSYLMKPLYKRLYDIGFDSVYRPYGTASPPEGYYRIDEEMPLVPARPELATMSNLRYIPPVLRLTDWGLHNDNKKINIGVGKKELVTAKEGIRYPCLNAPKYKRLVAERCRKVVSKFGSQSTSEYLYDQEPAFSVSWGRQNNTGVCYCPLCQKKFRLYLKKIYGSLQAVNHEYGTSYEEFSQITPPMLKDVTTKNAPLWADFRLAMSLFYSDFLSDMNNVIQKKQPFSRTGLMGNVGAMSAGCALDFWQISRWARLSTASRTETGSEIARDLSVPGSLCGTNLEWNWGIARAMNKDWACWLPWNNIFNGYNFIALYYGDTGFGTALANDLTQYKPYKIFVKEALRIKHGIGKLLLESKREKPVAILYSDSSIINAPILEKLGHIENIGIPRYGKIDSAFSRYNFRNWTFILKHCNIPAKYISYAQLANGLLMKSDYKILILPASTALSKKEIEGIKQFVKNGGTVIADICPGISDEHCKPWEKSSLDEVFGVKQQTRNPAIEECMVSFGANSQFGKLNLGVKRSSVSMRVTSGKPCGKIGKVPLAVINNYGKGKAVLMNFLPDKYFDIKSVMKHARKLSKESTGLRKFVNTLYDSFGGIRRLSVKPQLPLLQTYTWKDNGNRYIGFMQMVPEVWWKYSVLGKGKAKPLVEKETVIRFKNKAHIYNSLNGRYLGINNKIKAKVKPARPGLYALLPYKVSAVKIACMEKIKQGQAIEYTVSIVADKKPGKHVLRINMVDPEGKEMRHYSANKNCLNGKYTGTIELALNEAPGEYKLVVKDIATGFITSKPFNVIKRK